MTLAAVPSTLEFSFSLIYMLLLRLHVLTIKTYECTNFPPADWCGRIVSCFVLRFFPKKKREEKEEAWWKHQARKKGS